uniref:NADH-ubiquinone oxidoreductase chain 6 n=1 Tax=Scraptia sp. SCR03 TaxID=1205584 RepID=A0A0S2MQG8_9CUCU|nr:NADH deshydrogenase subunit 6 [Scraptia sp. SCR03]
MSLIILNILLSLLFIFLYHPLSMGLILIIQTSIICLVTGKLNLNFWYSYILFLILIGAMLILFIYMTSLASNEKFSINIKLTALFSVMMLILLLNMFIPTNEIVLNSEMLTQPILSYYTSSITKYLSFPSNMIFIFMIIYLFLTLIAIVKITNFKKGPLRQMN